MQPDKPSEETKVLVEMVERTRYPVKKGSKTEYLTLDVGRIVKCSKETAADFIKEKLAIEYDPDKLKVIEI